MIFNFLAKFVRDVRLNVLPMRYAGVLKLDISVLADVILNMN